MERPDRRLDYDREIGIGQSWSERAKRVISILVVSAEAAFPTIFRGQCATWDMDEDGNSETGEIAYFVGLGAARCW